MTIKQAGEREIEKMPAYFIPPLVLEYCNICGRKKELRCGVCFECQDGVETDLKEVWEIANPSHRWRYVYCTGLDALKRRLNN